MDILSIIGLIALAIFGKFLWDTYVTGKTDKDFQENKKRNPEEAARLELNAQRGQHLNFDYSPKRNADNRKISLIFLANLIGCETSDLKRIYQATLAKEIVDSHIDPIEFLKNKVTELRAVKARDALKMNFDPDDTPGALMCEWATEMLESTTRQMKIFEIENQIQQEKTALRQEMQRICVADVAETLGCKESDAEEVFKSAVVKDAKELAEQGIPEWQFFDSLKSQFQSEKQEQAATHDLDQEYTPGGIKEQWLDELIKLVRINYQDLRVRVRDKPGVGCGRAGYAARRPPP